MRILRNLRLIEPHEEAPLKRHQEDGLSCGLWAGRWVDRQLRENRGEAKTVPTSFAEMRKSRGWASRRRPRQIPRCTRLTRMRATASRTLSRQCSKRLPTKAGAKGCRACVGENS